MITTKLCHKNFIHIFPNEKFTDEFIDFINEDFNQTNHRFLLYGNSYKVNSLNKENVIPIKGRFIGWIQLVPMLYKCQGIILHSFYPRQIQLLLLIQPWLLKKLNIVFWGADLYSYLEPKDSMKQRFFEFARCFIIRNCGYVTTLVKEDYMLVKKWYKHKGVDFLGIYVDKSYELLKALKEEKELKKAGDTINILIGNNAQESNEHIEALNILEKYKDYNIKIYVPLSYSGTENYKEYVIARGKKIFGEKFIPIVDFVPKKQYYNHLKDIDIAIFNNNRQQAMGNIAALTLLGAKVYIRDDTTMWNHFVLDNGFRLYSMNSICELNFDSFIYKNINDLDHNTKMVKTLMSEEKRYQIWSDIFEKMKIHSKLNEDAK